MEQEALVVEERVEPRRSPSAAPGSVAGLLQRRAGPLGDLPVGLEAPVDLHRQLLEIGQALADEGKAGRHPGTLLQRLARPAEGEQRLGAGGQLARLEEATLLGALHRAADVGHASEREADLGLEQRARLVQPGE
jgi:hypothetical protein